MDLTGVFVPLITPFDEAGEVAAAALSRLAHQVLDDGATGLVALGTTGEPSSLRPPERAAVLDVIAEVCRERAAPLLVGADTVAAVQALRGRPAISATLSLVPPFVRPGPAGVVAYFRELASASPVPLVIYHVPYRTGQELTTDTLRQLAGIPGVVGLKYATGRIDADTVALLADRPDGFAVLGGDDAILSPLLALGADGGILASAHVATAGFAELVTAWRTGDAPRAGRVAPSLAALSRAMFAEPNPAVVKAVLHSQGRIPTPAVRLPLLPAAAPSLAEANAALNVAASLARTSEPTDHRSQLTIGAN